MREADRSNKVQLLYQIIEGLRPPFAQLLAVSLGKVKEGLGRVTVGASQPTRASYFLTEIGRRM